MSRLVLFFCLLLAVCFCVADINMHNPRGSNNRQNEGGRARANANRLFDSQNNNRGGHNSGREENQGKMYFYAGSKLQIQWANQHTCNDENNNCNIVIQYMCDENLRDGTTTRRIPVDKTDCENEDCDTDKKFGHHESLTYYEKCASRERNGGLFVADRELRNRMRDSAQSTRQNNGGTRRGYECPEEKDYYPYFSDSPWKDIAVLTNYDCSYYTANSQNVMPRHGCDFPDEYWDTVRGELLADNGRTDVLLSYDRATCESTNVTVNGNTYFAFWTTYPSHGIEAPYCGEPQWSRDNHQGNTYGGEFLSYWWTVPDIDADHCTLRIRYNISTNDFDAWNTDHTDNTRTGPAIVWQRMGFNTVTEAKRRGYVYRNDPNLDVFNLRREEKKFRLKINIDVTQFGRTFQDRSHSFAIRRRTPELENVNIHNINVRGKRGNIVQVYPTTEYDFVPNILEIEAGDYVHFQWMGSDRNPSGNAGQGRARTDRHNVVQMGLRPYHEGNVALNQNFTLGTNYPRDFHSMDLLGICKAGITALAFSGGYLSENNPGVTLDNANAYFDFGPVQATTPGVYHYFSTRNNAFSNRNQKGSIYVI